MSATEQIVITLMTAGAWVVVVLVGVKAAWDVWTMIRER